jgi:nucleoside-diphosphate-sugar epimerase
MPVWLVTGASGFLGRHVLAALGGEQASGNTILTSGRRPPSQEASETFLEADLTHAESVHRMIRAADPDVIIHLAGRTPPASPDDLYRSNTVATALLLDALRARGRAVRVVLAGSAAELGPVELADLPVGEDHPCRPVDPYGLSKWLATCAGLAARPPLEVIAARIFNPIGPGMSDGQALGRFAALLADPATTRMTVGDLDTRRDFIDGRDVAGALIALAHKGRPGLVYHVGTGRSRRVGDGLAHLIARRGRPVEVEVDPRLLARSGPRDSRAEIVWIVADTGWSPEVTWEQSLDDLWDDAVARRGCH